MSDNKINCPMCGSSLLEIVDGKTVHICEKDQMHKYVVTDSNILWTPILDLESDDEPIYFRKFDLNGVEVFDKETSENLLAVINSINESLREVIAEYTSLGEYVKALENKIEAYKAASKGAETTLFGRSLYKENVTPSGIILNK